MVADPVKRLSLNARVALDAARAAAAIYVVFYHLGGLHHWTGAIGLIFGFGQEVVIVFFVLSGFVIFANERDRLTPPFGYFLRRLLRIYPPLLCAMLVSTLVMADNGSLSGEFRWDELAATLFNLEDIAALKPGVIADPFLHNNALWSLSYEMAFYAVFPSVIAAWRRWPNASTHVIGAICCIAYASYALWPNHWSLVAAYFLTWWAGALAAQAYLRGERRIDALRAPLSWLAALCAVASLVATLDHGGRPIGHYPMLPLRHFAAAALLLLVLYGPIGRAIAGRLARWPRSWAWLASISYGIYVLHYPLLVQWRRVDDPLGFCSALVLLVIGATLIDRRLARLTRSSRSEPGGPGTAAP